jgi:hypothetical protein
MMSFVVVDDRKAAKKSIVVFTNDWPIVVESAKGGLPSKVATHRTAVSSYPVPLRKYPATWLFGSLTIGVYGNTLGKSVVVGVAEAAAEEALGVADELLTDGVDVDEGCAGSTQKKLVNDSPSRISSDQVPLPSWIPAWLLYSNVLPFEKVT